MGQPVRRKLELVSAPAPPSTPRGPLPPALDDAELVEALRSGDRSAAEALYLRLRPKIASTVKRLLGPNDAEWEDCVQLSFVEIVRSVDRYRGDSSLEHWAARVAAHVVYKHIRRRKTERKIFDRDGRTSDRPEPASTGRRIVARNLAERVRARLADITPEKVTAFLLHDVLGFDLREIADLTEVSVAAAQQRLVRGRREVHATIAADEELAELLEDLEDEP